MLFFPNYDPEVRIDVKTLDEKNPLSIFILYLYSMDSFIQMQIQKARDENSLVRARFLGPLATILGAIIGHRSEISQNQQF